MTYASIILPYDYKKDEINENPETTHSLKGKLTSAMQKGGAAIKNAIQNPGDTFKTLGKYMQDNQDTILNKFSGIALAQMLSSGKVTNQEALDYLFLGFAPAMDQQAIAMGYSGATQMKDAIKNGTINVGSFISGFTKTLKSITDFKLAQKNKSEQKANNIIELDATLNHNEQYQSESPDRRVQDGMSWQEVLHNLPDIIPLECALQDGRRYGVAEFKAIITQLRNSKKVFAMTIGDELYESLVIQNFNPSVVGARSGLDYTLEVKKVNIGSVELTPITIEPLDVSLYSQNESGAASGVSGNVNTPDIIPNSYKDDLAKMVKNKRRSWAKNLLEPI